MAQSNTHVAKLVTAKSRYCTFSVLKRQAADLRANSAAVRDTRMFHSTFILFDFLHRYKTDI